MTNPDERNDPPRPLMEHLLALRDMIVFAAVSWACCAIAAGCFSPRILGWIKSPVDEYVRTHQGQSLAEGLSQAISVQGLDITSGFSTIMSIAIWGGTALAFPFILFAILRFVFPALTKREKVVIMSILVSGAVLFTIGTGLAYAKTLPMVVSAFQAINDWVGLPVQTLRIESYTSIVLKTVIAFGLVFQMPLIIFVLGWFGIVTSQALREKRRIAIVMAFVVAMFLTPPDPMSQIIMAVPLCLLYELSIWAVWLKERA